MNLTAQLISQAKTILHNNDLGGYTIPTQGLYPFQWNWDAGITALGWSEFDEARAWQEFDMLLKGQWSNGMVPHIVFHCESDQYFPGPDQWGVTRQPPTSTISQPPLLATIVRLMLQRACDKELANDRAAALLPSLIAYQRYWYTRRDPEQTGLVVSYHPWESGMDNSPAWDQALMRVPAVQRSYQRKDLSHVDADQRPKQEQYDRYLYLVDLFKKLQFDSAAIYKQSPYKVQDVGLNAILYRANADLLALCEHFGYQGDEVNELKQAAARTQSAIADCWSDSDRCFLSRDMINGELIRIKTSGGVLPLYAQLATAEQAGQMAGLLQHWMQEAPFGVASTHPTEADFDAKRYWRGPTWLHINWMISLGLSDYSFAQLADNIALQSRKIVEQSGFWEYYNPHTAEPCGGPDFSWTAAIALYWLLNDK